MRFHIHKWSKWGKPFDSVLNSSKKAQARICETCGKHQVAYVQSPWNWWFSSKQITDSLGIKEVKP
jgi:hypothetical protein